VAEDEGQSGNPEERKRPPLEAVTRGFLKIRLSEKTYLLAVVNFRVCEIAMAPEIIVVTGSKSQINPLVTVTRDNIHENCQIYKKVKLSLKQTVDASSLECSSEINFLSPSLLKVNSLK
jgi:hypothetical protein